MAQDIQTIRELIDTLEEIAGTYGDDLKVRLAQQPNYPLMTEGAVVGCIENEVVCDNCDGDKEDEDGDPCSECRGRGKVDASPTAVYIGERGGSNNYLDSEGIAALDWRR